MRRLHPRAAAGLLALLAVVVAVPSASARPRFAPRVQASVDHHVRKDQHPALTITVRQRRGEEPMRTVVVLLPPQLQPVVRVLIRTCKMAVVAAGACPPRSHIGSAVAVSSALPQALRGPVILAEPRVPPEGRLGIGLPNLLLDLHAGALALPITVQQRFGTSGRLRTLMRHLPEVPVQRFTLRFVSRRDGPLKAAVDLCRRHVQRLDVRLRSHDGRRVRRKPHLQVPCGHHR